jgi:hypothetical protein
MVIPAKGGIVELKCNSRFCGARSGVVVLHQFSTGDGVLVDTKKYKDTPKIRERTNHNG